MQGELIYQSNETYGRLYISGEQGGSMVHVERDSDTAWVSQACLRVAKNDLHQPHPNLTN